MSECDELDPTGATPALAAGETRVLDLATDGRADDFQVMLRAAP